jgi:hypothetical protein
MSLAVTTTSEGSMSGELSVTRKNSPTFRTGFVEAETDRLGPLPLPTANFPLPIYSRKAKYQIPK